MGSELTLAEYFAGIGLVRMGLEELGWRVVFANDFDPRKYEMYADFYPNDHEHYVVEDVFDVKAGDAPEALLATCSFPCIDLSLAGNMNGMGGRHSSAFWGFIKILEQQGERGPALVMVENVPGWLASNKGEDFRVTVEALNRLGYMCDVLTLDARRFTPQSRERVFLVGAKHRKALESPAPLLTRPASLQSKRLRQAIQEHADLLWMYNELPEPPALRKEGLTTEVVEELGVDDARWWSKGEVERHLEMMAPAHRKRVEALRDGERYAHRTFYRRVRHGMQRAEVRPDDIAGCLRTAVGGSSRQFLLRAGKGEVRMRVMTAVEYARLQGAPKEYEKRIKVNGNQALTGFGDAVCVPVLAWIGEHLLAPLAEEAGAGASVITAESVG